MRTETISSPIRFRLAIFLGLLFLPAAGFGQVLLSTGNVTGLRMWGPNVSDWWLDILQNRLDVRVNGGPPWLTILPNGSVGLSTTTPGHALDVQGADGYVNAKNGFCISGGNCLASWPIGLAGGTTNYYALWTGGSGLGIGALYQSGGFIGIGTTNPANALSVNGSATVSGTMTVAGAFVGQSSVTASAFFGDGSHLSGISASGGETSYFAPAKTFGSSVTVQGDSAVAGTMTVAGVIVGQSSVTASAFFGDGSHLSGISGGAGETPYFAPAKTFGSFLTVQGSAFSVGASTFLVTSGNVGIGVSIPAAALVLEDGTGSGV